MLAHLLSLQWKPEQNVHKEQEALAARYEPVRGCDASSNPTVGNGVLP
jgi:hypothetical protein